MAQLTSARAKLARAYEHLNAAKEITDRLCHPNSNCWRIAAIPDVGKKGGFSVIVEKMEPIPERFMVLIGDAAHNLRSALDHIAFALAKPVSPKKEKDIAFPLLTQRGGFRRRAKICLPGVPRKVRAEIQRLQPYHGRSWCDTKILGKLQTINNWDKHRALLFSVIAPANSTYRVECNPPMPISEQKFFANRPFKAGTKIAWFKLKIPPDNPPIEVEVKVICGFVVGPVLDKRMPRDVRNAPVLGTLKVCADKIRDEIIPRFEAFL
jgi:hypothetical protein